MAVDMDLIQTIVDLDNEMMTEKRRLKEMRNDFTADVKVTQEYGDLQDAKQEVKIKQAYLDRVLVVDHDLRDQRNKIVGQAEKLKDLREIMSHHLVKYFEDSGRRVITMRDIEEITREIVVTAKLGREAIDPDNMQMEFGK